MATPLKPKVQELIIFGLSNGGFSYKSQKVFHSRKFFDAVRFLKHFGYAVPICAVCKIKLIENEMYICDKKNFEHSHFNIRERIFKLTLRGELLARELKRY